MSQGFLKKRETKIVRMDGDRFAFERKGIYHGNNLKLQQIFATAFQKRTKHVTILGLFLLQQPRKLTHLGPTNASEEKALAEVIKAARAAA